MVPPDDDQPRIPEHVHGTSAHWANIGCKHPLCLAERAAQKRRDRQTRRERRVKVTYFRPDGSRETRLVHPDLDPPTSDASARHGTANARREYGCECPHCEGAAGRNPEPETD